jgi:hypothetical protein
MVQEMVEKTKLITKVTEKRNKISNKPLHYVILFNIILLRNCKFEKGA